MSRRVGFAATCLAAAFFATFADFSDVLPAIAFAPIRRRLARCATRRHTAARTSRTSEHEKGEREQRQEAHPDGGFLLHQGDDIDDDRHGEGDGQPAVNLPNPRVPIQWYLL